MEDEKVAGELQTGSSPILPPSSPGSEGKLDGMEPPDVPSRLQHAGKCHIVAASCQSAALSSSDEEKEELEVQVRLEIHSPPVDAPVQLQEDGEEKKNPPPCSPAILADNSNWSKTNPVTPPPPPVLSCSTSPPSPQTPPPVLTSRHWAPPKGFWRVARPETLLLNGLDPHNAPVALPCKDYAQGEDKTGVLGGDGTEAASEMGRRVGVCASLQGGGHSADVKEKVRQRDIHTEPKERQQNCSEAHYGDATGTDDYEDEGVHGGSEDAIILQELEPYLRSLLVINDDELPLSPRHEQAKRLLERARLKARSNHVKGDRPSRRSHSDHRSSAKKQEVEAHNPVPVQKAVKAKEDHVAQSAAGPLLVPDQGDTSPEDQAGRSRRYGCSPTRVRFEDESEREAESRYLDRVRQRGRPAVPKSKNKDSNTDSSSSGSERKSHRSVSMAPLLKPDMGVNAEITTVIREIIVLVKKCEACGSVVREPQPVSSLADQQIIESQPIGNQEDTRGRTVPCWVPPTKPEVSTRPKAPLTVTFAGAFVLGENKESRTGWKTSGFGKLRRRSRKGESRLESGNGPYGPSWAQRRNSNPRNRVNLSRAVSFAPDSPVMLEPRLLGAPGGVREAPTLPIKSALKSSSRNRSAVAQSTVQFQIASSQAGDGGPQNLAFDCPEARREPPASVAQGATATNNPAACIRPSTLRYSPARLNPDMPAADVWDASLDGTASADTGSGSEFHPAIRTLALSRAEDLRAELLRAEHLKAEAGWEDSSDGSRKPDGRPKLFLRRFFSSIGLNSVGRLVKGGRSSSMEQLSLPASRSNTASPSPTHRLHPAIRIQRTPSLQTLHTALPLAQLRKASSVQSLERRTERTTILGEVQIPYGLAPSPDSPRLELHRTLSVEDILPSRVVRPAGRVSQAFPDGSLLLELIRPPNGPFGFVISRGKGRPDTGVYVEKVGDGTGEVPYVGLLGVGDEILQVNREVVAGLSLDQVTRLMTRESVASLRIMPARRSPR
ncbi:uncharacterized protein LOC133510556 [Syngnathoides biaculeatus]|uniref:uncharacterized protein LOC133510556 n=1 Tax=Syngnathoides biaculeatus TaxID=300417 RepID=UPI002ADDFA1E|nr:uncharacterized protein LOC133510556 [Syngnathoides biaculeatus]XP_061694583.1 uncharacterized protein LOC133510556 [Syngnathoides biaculeatus]XP_061694584.1 uncharacterized protein LOC133510556 [Syngnathoides biaculeatus]